MIIEWRKKPVVVQAVQYTGENFSEIQDFVGVSKLVQISEGLYSIRTLDGNMQICLDDFIIKGVKGELYPCKPDIFYATYERHLVWEDNI